MRRNNLNHGQRRNVTKLFFDSDKDNWAVGTCVFGSRVMNRSDLAFVVEDTEGNKFGEYLQSEITGYGTTIRDENAFLFSLTSNGRMNGMMKFEIKKNCVGRAFKMWDDEDLCSFGFNSSDVFVKKSDRKSESYVKYDRTFDFQGINTGLTSSSTGHTNFTPNRIVVIQMV